MRVFASLKYGFYILGHPFDGFWRLKSERRGDLRSAGVLMLLFLLTTVVRIYSTGYLFDSVSVSRFSLWLYILGVLAVFFLYCTANWALTTLLDGKGSYIEIMISVCYALIPVILVNLPLALLSNIITLDESAYYRFFYGLSVAWALFLLLAGNLSVHDFTMLKSIATVVATFVSMLIIAVLIALFGNLVQQVYVFVSSVVREIAFRL